MIELESFRTETRDWLEANCPAEMRKPLRSEDDACWGGRNWTFQSDAQRQWLRAHGRTRLDRSRLAEGIWRRRPVAATKRGCSSRRWRGSARARR